MLFLSAVLNGVLAPPLIVLVVLLTSDSALMGNRRSGLLMRMLGWTCAAVMTACSIGMCVS
jgi:Mn2+/Fe2+ NRAMP family transporter